MSSETDFLSILKDMGFSEIQAKTALDKTGWSSVESAAEWLFANPIENVESNEGSEQQNSEHSKLTENERIAQTQRLEEVRAKKRIERENKEKKEEVEREKKRIEEGKNLLSIKRLQSEKDMKKIVEERRQEKLEEKLARDRVKAQIEHDKKERKEREARERGEATISSTTVYNASPISSNTISKEYHETKIQIRQLDGVRMEQTFKVKETLAAVRLYVQLNRKDVPGTLPKLMTTFPKKVFTEEDYEATLEYLNLVPSACIVISP